MDKFNRRDLVVGAVITGIVAKSKSAFGAAKKEEKPNIIFIMADDLGYADLSCTGSHHIYTPNIDKLRIGGVLFTQAYSNSCICSATRTGLALGCYQDRFRIGLEEPLSPRSEHGLSLPKNMPTIATVLKEQGYRTGLIGKWHLGEPPLNGPLSYGYDSFFGIAQGAADYFRHKIIFDGQAIGSGLFEGNQEIQKNGYITDLLGDEAVKFISQKSNDPFFLSLHFTAPHWPWEGREDEEVAKKVKNIMHFSGGSLQIYKKMVEAMDENVGKLTEALRKLGKLHNTIIVFTSDNGGERFSETWPFIGTKGELFEGGIRVPLIVNWPAKIKANSTTNQVMSSMDFLPTFQKIAGGKYNSNDYDGIDISEVLVNPEIIFERTLFWRFKANSQAAIRKGDYKYLAIGGREYLFNLKEDPHERAQLQTLEPDKFKDLKTAWQDWNAKMLPFPENSYSEQVKDAYPDRY